MAEDKAPMKRRDAFTWTAKDQFKIIPPEQAAQLLSKERKEKEKRDREES